MSQSSGGRGTLASGRETVGALLKGAQLQLRKVFIVFLLGLVGTIRYSGTSPPGR
jgi:sec-independent protein translocase protein TatC